MRCRVVFQTGEDGVRLVFSIIGPPAAKDGDIVCRDKLAELLNEPNFDKIDFRYRFDGLIVEFPHLKTELEAFLVLLSMLPQNSLPVRSGWHREFEHYVLVGKVDKEFHFC